MAIESRFILSPILSYVENQEKIKAIIEETTNEDNHNFVIKEIEIAGPDHNIQLEFSQIEENKLALSQLKPYHGENHDEIYEAIRLSNMKQLAESTRDIPTTGTAHRKDDSSGNLDAFQAKRTSDNMRREFLSKLTYNKVWLTP